MGLIKLLVGNEHREWRGIELGMTGRDPSEMRETEATILVWCVHTKWYVHTKRALIIGLIDWYADAMT